MDFKPLTSVQKEFWSNRGRLICVLGLPASGKSTFGFVAENWLKSQGIEAKYYCEKINKTFLEAYLRDPKSLAASFQYTTATNRLNSYKEALNYCKTGGIAIMDGMLYSDPPFEQFNYNRGYISDSLHSIYEDILSETKTLDMPDFIAFLDVESKNAIARLHKRSTAIEVSSYNVDFYQQMYNYNANTLKNVELEFIDYNKDVGKELESHVIETLRRILKRKNTRIGLPSKQETSNEMEQSTITAYFKAKN